MYQYELDPKQEKKKPVQPQRASNYSRDTDLDMSSRADFAETGQRLLSLQRSRGNRAVQLVVEARRNRSPELSAEIVTGVLGNTMQRTVTSTVREAKGHAYTQIETRNTDQNLVKSGRFTRSMRLAPPGFVPPPSWVNVANGVYGYPDPVTGTDVANLVITLRNVIQNTPLAGHRVFIFTGVHGDDQGGLVTQGAIDFHREDLGTVSMGTIVDIAPRTEPQVALLQAIRQAANQAPVILAWCYSQLSYPRLLTNTLTRDGGPF